jgi:hypothetical protein
MGRGAATELESIRGDVGQVRLRLGVGFLLVLVGRIARARVGFLGGGATLEGGGEEFLSPLGVGFLGGGADEFLARLGVGFPGGWGDEFLVRVRLAKGFDDSANGRARARLGRMATMNDDGR